MPLLFVRNDITRMHTDAIVCPTDARFSASGGTDAAIRRRAGVRLRAACLRHGALQSGEVFRTPGFRLPCRYVFHVHGPVWHGGDTDAQRLADCYTRVLEAALDSGCESVAFPLLSAGRFGFPIDTAMRTAVQTIRQFPRIEDVTVYLVLYDPQCVALAAQYRFLERELTDTDTPDRGFLFLSGSEASSPRPLESASMRARRADLRKPKARNRASEAETQTVSSEADPLQDLSDDDLQTIFSPEEKNTACAASLFSVQRVYDAEGEEDTLETLLAQTDESFSEMLLRLIDERGMTDAQCYKKANIDRKHFSKIRSNRLYKPSKNTALAFAVALCLTPDQTKELLQKAGYALTHSSKADIIVEYYIRRGVYDIFVINEALFAYDQSLLG